VLASNLLHQLSLWALSAGLCAHLHSCSFVSTVAKTVLPHPFVVLFCCLNDRLVKAHMQRWYLQLRLPSGDTLDDSALQIITTTDSTTQSPSGFVKKSQQESRPDYTDSIFFSSQLSFVVGSKPVLVPSCFGDARILTDVRDMRRKLFHNVPDRD
jgi:hypothetical protein